MILPVNYNELTFDQRIKVREEYIKRQRGLCFWCNHSLELDPPKMITKKWIDWRLFPKEFLKAPIHLQHDRVTGLTEGAVHAYCNAVMWQYHHR